jgi:thymidylate synthase (FAD)
VAHTRLIWYTPEAEKHIAYCARVSSSNQENPEYAKLLRFLIENRHWSPFEMASACFEIVTSRAIAQQILRHRSFHFQEFSQRYAEATEIIKYPARRQAEKNRQSSIDDLDPATRQWFDELQVMHYDESIDLYEAALEKGIAKEQARFLLPLATATKIYMAGTVRDWIHYLSLRTDEHTQLEHREIAEEIKETFGMLFPHTDRALVETDAVAWS